MRISDWSSDVCSSDLGGAGPSWGCRVGGSLKRSGAAEGREPAGRSSRRRCSSSSSSGLTMRRVRSYPRSEEHTSELQSLMRISYAVFCLKKTDLASHMHDAEQQQSYNKYQHLIPHHTFCMQ